MTKCTVFVAIFSLILLIKTINGQHNEVFCNENFKTNSPVLQSQPRTYTMINSFQDFWDQNGKTIPLTNNVNQNPILMQTNTPPLSSNTQEIELPPDLLQKTLQVQQYLQLQNPLQQTLPLQQAQYPLQQIEAQPALIPIQSSDFVQLQPPIQVQPEQHVTIQQALQTQPPLQTTPTLPTYQPIQNVQPLQFQQSLHSQQPVQTSQPFNLQHTIQESFQVPHPVQQQQVLGFQQNTPQNTLTISENKNRIEAQQRSSNLPNTQIRVKWQSSNSPPNVEKRQSTQNFNIQRQQNSINHPVEGVDTAQKFSNKPQEVPTLRYYVAAPQPHLQSPASAITPIVPSYQSVATIPSNYIKAAEETYASVASPYNYLIPISDVPLPILENTKSISSIPQASSILAIPSPQSHFCNQDSRQNTYINSNLGVRYIEQSQVPIVLQGQQTLLTPSQSSILSPIPFSIVQAPSVSPNYEVSTGYPANSIVAPVYTSVKSKSSNLKSILPLIFDLLRAKIGSCGCRNNCPCQCKNNNSDKELEITSGYSSQRDFRTFPNVGLSAINAVSEEIEGPACVRKPKNCKKIKNISLEMSDTLEEDDYDEEEEEDS